MESKKLANNIVPFTRKEKGIKPVDEQKISTQRLPLKIKYLPPPPERPEQEQEIVSRIQLLKESIPGKKLERVLEIFRKNFSDCDVTLDRYNFGGEENFAKIMKKLAENDPDKDNPNIYKLTIQDYFPDKTPAQIARELHPEQEQPEGSYDTAEVTFSILPDVFVSLNVNNATDLVTSMHILRRRSSEEIRKDKNYTPLISTESLETDPGPTLGQMFESHNPINEDTKEE